MVSHDLETNRWQVFRDADHIEVTEESERGRALRALDHWMIERETTFGHPVFVHPNVIHIDPC